ncbi:MAG: transcription elongation factor GreA [Anaerolineaceae bacterium]|nr:transcription elongation factor GreA [Anaerolineaceae bacterium]MCY3934545.1 transcription elongation factor GreA [Chloroflexota bacterium]MCY4008698.1 transcription elongation factor GreA [Anaerolineaceae bacterium]MCY4107325.1 transcription elongation factor GreA [Chloroflexota bacterium]
MAKELYYLTADGQSRLEKQLRDLIDVRRPQVAERLHSALDEGGELMENAEYEDAKNEQAFVEGEISRLQGILNNVEIIEISQDSGVVQLGSRVKIREKGEKEELVYQLVGSVEANPREGRISWESPLGAALMGAKVRQRVTVQAPDGEIVYVVRAIE